MSSKFVMLTDGSVAEFSATKSLSEIDNILSKENLSRDVNFPTFADPLNIPKPINPQTNVNQPIPSTTNNRPLIDNPAIPLKQKQEILALKPVETSSALSLASKMKQINDLADEILQNDEGLKSATGFGGTVSSFFAGTKAADAKAKIDRLKSMISINEIQKMRAESKTGGAVGSMTEKEWPRFESAYGSLEQAQSYDQFVSELAKVKKLSTDMINGVKNKYEQTYGKNAEFDNIINQERFVYIKPDHIEILKSDPSPLRKQQFDKKYGKGQADKILGVK